MNAESNLVEKFATHNTITRIKVIENDKTIEEGLF